MTMKDQQAPNSIRTYDSDGYRQRAAAVCVKDEKGDEVRFELLHNLLMGSKSSKRLEDFLSFYQSLRLLVRFSS